MGMTNKEETLDWLYRLRSEIYVYMPKDWIIPFADALDMAIKALEQETVSKEVYDHEYFLRKEFELKIDKLQHQLKALEQEPILDKIRAEIEALPKTYPFINHIDTYVKEDDVKKIIDKYESEDKE